MAPDFEEVLLGDDVELFELDEDLELPEEARAVVTFGAFSSTS